MKIIFGTDPVFMENASSSVKGVISTGSDDAIHVRQI